MLWLLFVLRKIYTRYGIVQIDVMNFIVKNDSMKLNSKYDMIKRYSIR